VEPGNADASAGAKGGDLSAGGVDDAGDFVPEDEREFGVALEEIPIGGGEVEIGVTDAAGVDFDEHLVGGGFGKGQLLKDEGLAELVEDGGAHRLSAF
jgi:hypothetical protein